MCLPKTTRILRVAPHGVLPAVSASPHRGIESNSESKNNVNSNSNSNDKSNGKSNGSGGG
ncbi:hypothetical protein NB709_001578 [Xanthomonas sacchari]|nr:hypothetical protein [Xanthomonas sacchari]